MLTTHLPAPAAAHRRHQIYTGGTMPIAGMSTAAIVAVAEATEAIAGAIKADREYRVAVFKSGNEAAIAALAKTMEMETEEKGFWFDLFGPVRDFFARLNADDDSDDG